MLGTREEVKKRPIPRHLRIVKDPENPEVIDHEQMKQMDVRAAFITRFGPECAAWLCNRFRRNIRRVGFFTAHMPGPDVELPSWFDIAISYLEKHRSKRWKVEKSVIRGARYYRVVWLGKPSLPAAIVPVGQA